MAVVKGHHEDHTRSSPTGVCQVGDTILVEVHAQAEDKDQKRAHVPIWRMDPKDGGHVLVAYTDQEDHPYQADHMLQVEHKVRLD